MRKTLKVTLLDDKEYTFSQLGFCPMMVKFMELAENNDIKNSEQIDMIMKLIRKSLSYVHKDVDEIIESGVLPMPNQQEFQDIVAFLTGSSDGKKEE